ncbi:MAG: MarR family winged helix-turn-helix transcriptional regulator [Eubacterium sp.]|nr:MarR family winged helix-turn-helix transcriptional regulator [Eubacterium sp.]
MRKRSPLENVCRNLMNSMDSHKGITEDQAFAFMDELSVEEPKDLADMPADYRKLKFSISEVWQYREWQELSPEQAFLYGSVWGSARLFELKQQKRRETDRMKILVPKYRDKYWMFQAIKSQPGILHKELAKKGNISPSRLSQIMDDSDIDFLISHRESGREKYYFLKPQGEELFAKLKTNDRKVLGSYTEPLKAISINNDSTRNMYGVKFPFNIGVIENSIIVKTLGISPRNKIWDIIGNDITTKNTIGVNEWTQKANYMNILEKNHLKYGSEISLVR